MWLFYWLFGPRDLVAVNPESSTRTLSSSDEPPIRVKRG